MTFASDRSELMRQLRGALAALEAGDDVQAQTLLCGACTLEQRPLAQGVVKLACEVRDAMRALDLDSRIADLADGEIKDACTHLDHVVRMTEDAAHRTLDLVDDSRRVVNELSASVGGQGVDDVVDIAVTRLRSNLMSLALAQEYQDLSGQLIRRVIALVRQVEQALGDLVRVAGPTLDVERLKDEGRAPIVSAEAQRLAELKGPAAANSASQQDADDLLADLGF